MTGGPGTDYHYTRDHLGSIREVVETDGDVYLRYDYTPWGERLKLGGTATTAESDAFEWGFTGHHYHARSGLHLALYRAYDANLGRWLSEDPLGEAGGLNLYGYVGNAPVSAWDPLGLCGDEGEPYVNLGVGIGGSAFVGNILGPLAHGEISLGININLSNPFTGSQFYFNFTGTALPVGPALGAGASGQVFGAAGINSGMSPGSTHSIGGYIEANGVFTTGGSVSGYLNVADIDKSGGLSENVNLAGTGKLGWACGESFGIFGGPAYSYTAATPSFSDILDEFDFTSLLEDFIDYGSPFGY